jgi:hypothetical protein
MNGAIDTLTNVPRGIRTAAPGEKRDDRPETRAKQDVALTSDARRDRRAIVIGKLSAKRSS